MNTMLRKTRGWVIGVCGALVLSSTLDVSADSGSARTQDWDRIEGRIESAMYEWQLPGLAVGVALDGEVIYAKGFGVRDIESQQPVDSKTLFPLGAGVEPFTSLLFGTLVDEGSVDLDEPLARKYPEYRLRDRAVSKLVTARDLLAQRTGLGERSPLDGPALRRDEVVHRLRDVSLDHSFRSEFSSSVLNVVAAEALVEKVTGLSWEEAISSRILAPLGMGATSFGVGALNESDNRVCPHRLDSPLGKPVVFEFSNPNRPQGWINSNVEDLLRWLDVYVKPARSGLVEEETIREMYEPHVFVYWPSSGLISATSYGLFWGVNSYRGHTHARLGGFGDGFDSVVSFYPADGLAIVLLANRGGDVLALLSALKFEITDQILGLPDVDWIDWARQRRRS